MTYENYTKIDQEDNETLATSFPLCIAKSHKNSREVTQNDKTNSLKHVAMLDSYSYVHCTCCCL